MIIMNQVLSIISSFSVKIIWSELCINKQPLLKWHVSCAIKKGNKKTKQKTKQKNPNCEVEWKHNYLNEIISQGFSLLWKLAQMPTFKSFVSSSTSSEQSTQVVKLKKRRMDECLSLKHDRHSSVLCG